MDYPGVAMHFSTAEKFIEIFISEESPFDSSFIGFELSLALKKKIKKKLTLLSKVTRYALVCIYTIKIPPMDFEPIFYP